MSFPRTNGMNDNKAPWQRTLRAFAGSGIDHPSETMAVGAREAAAIRAGLVAETWLSPVYCGEGRHAGYSVCNSADSGASGLFQDGILVGFYAGSVLWIAKAHRGLGLYVPLILAAAARRGGTVLPPGVVSQGYTAAGVEAHREAHRQAVATALAQGLPVPAAVLDEIRSESAALLSAG